MSIVAAQTLEIDLRALARKGVERITVENRVDRFGNLTYQIRRFRAKKRKDQKPRVRTDHADSGKLTASLEARLDFSFEPFVLCWKGPDVIGVCRLSETRWYMLREVWNAGDEGASFESIITAVPEWDINETDDGRVKAEAGKTGDEMKNAGIPFYLSTETVCENTYRTQIARIKEGLKPSKQRV